MTLTPEEEREIREWAVGYCLAIENQEIAPVKEADWIVGLLAALDVARLQREAYKQTTHESEDEASRLRERNAKLERVVGAAWNTIHGDSLQPLINAMTALEETP